MYSTLAPPLIVLKFWHSSTFGGGGEFDWLNEWANQNERANQNVLINAKDSQCNISKMYYLYVF